MTAHLDLVASDPTTANQATRKSYVDAAVAAASTAASNAQTTANTANTTATAALPSAYINGGLVTATSNGAGDIAFAHGLGAAPRTVVLIPYIPGGGTLPWQVGVEAKDAANVNVRVFHNDPAVGVWTGVAVAFFWLALR